MGLPTAWDPGARLARDTPSTLPWLLDGLLPAGVADWDWSCSFPEAVYRGMANPGGGLPLAGASPPSPGACHAGSW